MFFYRTDREYPAFFKDIPSNCIPLFSKGVRDKPLVCRGIGTNHKNVIHYNVLLRYFFDGFFWKS